MGVFRRLHAAMLVYKEKYPVMALTGPRQSGKTTLLRTLFPDYRYVSLENPDNRQFAETDPNGFLREYNSHVIFDEVQRVPHLFSYIQTIVDASGMMGQFILSGSQNFHLMEHITQSLAGRVALFRLLPFDMSEMASANYLDNDFAKAAIRGFYPALFDRDIPSKIFYSNYIATYIERDISEVLQVRDSRLFRKFLSLCAGRAGQLLNLNAMANECGITQPTAKAWLSVLESSYIVFLLQPYYKNFNKRIIKTPKLYFYDTGLLAHLLRIADADKLRLTEQKGMLFENMIIGEKLKQNYHQYLQQELYFWRDAAGKEVDLLILNDEGLDLYEIKSTQTITTPLFEGLNFLSGLAESEVNRKILIYAGDTSQQRSYVEVRAWRNC
jgi:predicted AAA+ superfamily ATPase